MQMTLWIAKEILSCDQPRKRCALVQKLVAIAEYCRELRNYVTIFQITAALCSSSIQRLKKTWDLVPQSVSYVEKDRWMVQFVYQILFIVSISLYNSVGLYEYPYIVYYFYRLV